MSLVALAGGRVGGTRPRWREQQKACDRTQRKSSLDFTACVSRSGERGTGPPWTPDSSTTYRAQPPFDSYTPGDVESHIGGPYNLPPWAASRVSSAHVRWSTVAAGVRLVGGGPRTPFSDVRFCRRLIACMILAHRQYAAGRARRVRHGHRPSRSKDRWHDGALTLEAQSAAWLL